MIVSHKHRFIFFAVPKTATHTIREALRPHLGSDDWEQQVLFGQQFLPVPELASLGHGHISVREIRPHLDARQWRDYFKFGFVRNPFDRFVSICFFLNRGNAHFAHTARAFMKDRLPRPRFQQRVLVRPQYLQLCTDDDRLALDFVGRYEDLQRSFDFICEQIGIPNTQLGSKNASEHAAYRDYYDDELQRMVASFYAADLRHFNYRDAL